MAVGVIRPVQVILSVVLRALIVQPVRLKSARARASVVCSLKVIVRINGATTVEACGGVSVTVG